MQLAVFYFLFTTFLVVLGNSCDHLGVLLYEDLGCIPHYNESSSCPVKYSCQGLEQSSDVCYFRGQPYKNQESVEEGLLDPSCDRDCFCEELDGRSRFICAVLDCPEALGVTTRKGCYPKYALDQCCSVGEVCPPFKNLAKCVVDGIEYREGEQFYPKNTCHICVCQKGFKGVIEEPFCRKWKCGVQLKNPELGNGCAPWYERKEVFCCPNNWICPNGKEEIRDYPLSDDICKFGEKMLKVGQSFERYNVKDSFDKIVDKVKCECVIPPLVTCVDA